MDWRHGRMSGRTVRGSLIPVNAGWHTPFCGVAVLLLTACSARWYGRLIDKAHISAGPLELLCKATWTYLERFQALILHLPEAGHKTGYWVWLGAVVKVCCRGRRWGEWAEDVSFHFGFTCYKNRFMVSFLPFTWKCYLLILERRLCLFPVRGFDKGPGLLDAKLGKQSISGKSARMYSQS